MNSRTRRLLGVGLVAVGGYYLWRQADGRDEGGDGGGEEVLSPTASPKSPPPNPDQNMSWRFSQCLLLPYELERGLLVQAVQHSLYRLGVNPSGNIDGIYGPITEEAVRDFQSLYSQAVSPIQVDGIVGPETYAALDDFMQSQLGERFICEG